MGSKNIKTQSRRKIIRKTICNLSWFRIFIYIKAEDFFEDISSHVQKWFDTSNYDKNDKRPFPIGKNKKVSGLFKDELGGKTITEVVALRPKAYAYLDDDGNNHKKAKGTKKVCNKTKTSYNHDVYTEEVNKIALRSNDDKRLKTFDRITTYPSGTNVFKVCDIEMLMVKDLFLENCNEIVLEH